MILILILLIFIIFIIVNFRLPRSEYFTSTSIPHVIVSTYSDKKEIPQKVYDNIKKYAQNYKYKIYDDQEIIQFLKKYYPPNVIQAFYSLDKGAHKADLFRYCYLYQFGGIYLDIKTELIQPLSTLFNKNAQLYTVLSMHKGTVYQGIIASVPKNPLFLELIETIVMSSKPIKRYFQFTRDFYKKLIMYYNVQTLKEGYLPDPNGKYNLYLFQEDCSRNAEQCKDGLDRYGKCCFVYDKQHKIIKTRYSDYPW